jgi:hypothetical protein
VAILRQPRQQEYGVIIVLLDYFTANVILPELTFMENYTLFKESIKNLPN